ncbi:MAG: peptidoglycan DD-metalloendopeptidase family protein [Lachnospiraceae bacterium]|nr:peptidoglycan DD-metalloendopeptidase family protein [Lachnospiraceae bacterium]
MQDPFVFRFKPVRHKRRVYRHLILTTDDTGTRPKVIKYNISTFITIAVLLFLVLGGFIGLVIFEHDRDERYELKLSEKEQRIEELSASNTELSTEIASLNNKIEILSNTVTTKTASEAELVETLEAQAVPSEFPLTGSASFKENTGDIPECVFTASEGTTVVATAAGVVEDVLEDETYGNAIVVDHGNGYKTYYKNLGDSMVRKGDSVSAGTTLFIIGSDNSELCYQISNNGEYINPLDILQING